MNLLIDVGNTQIKFVTEHNYTFSDINRISHQDFTPKYFDEQWKEIKNIIIACVGNKEISTRLLQWAEQKNICYKQVKTPAQKFSITVGYKNFEQFGVDRWLALLGAEKIFPKTCCLIIDAGTATTIDLLSAEGNHQGGWIIPGLATMHTSLALNTHNISVANNVSSQTDFGDNTNDNVINGCFAATIGAIKLAMTEVEKKGLRLEHIILTGGNANSIKEYFNDDINVIDNLLFQGLSRYLSSIYT